MALAPGGRGEKTCAFRLARPDRPGDAGARRRGGRGPDAAVAIGLKPVPEDRAGGPGRRTPPEFRPLTWRVEGQADPGRSRCGAGGAGGWAWIEPSGIAVSDAGAEWWNWKDWRRENFGAGRLR